ncbi:MAG: dihydrofolate reductase [Gammaproteobacteria bacterium]|jgi:dihydrofolate reductase|nr:dihydrofolate reductase [Gammaproteobacteria bacterium]MBT7602990.1 dihydrofolate reductase [Gammaproteobacteria bacterium]
MIISIIVAMSKNRVIGKDNNMPWHLSDDLKNFKKITSGKTIIMGRKTYESIGKPLPNRKNIILSRKFEDKNIIVVKNIDEALSLSKKESEVFIIGGEDIYKQTVHMATKLYLTMIDDNIDGDKYFPEINLLNWRMINSFKCKKNESNSHNFTSQIFTR